MTSHEDRYAIFLDTAHVLGIQGKNMVLHTNGPGSRKNLFQRYGEGLIEGLQGQALTAPRGIELHYIAHHILRTRAEQQCQ